MGKKSGLGECVLESDDDCGGRDEGRLPWQPAVEAMGGEQRWQTPNYLAARLLASLVCAPLHMFYAYETRNVINRLAAAANSRRRKKKNKRLKR